LFAPIKVSAGEDAGILADSLGTHIQVQGASQWPELVVDDHDVLRPHDHLYVVAGAIPYLLLFFT
jgi:hypothetical protein